MVVNGTSAAASRANAVGLFLDFGQVLAALASFVIRPVAIEGVRDAGCV